MPQCGQSRAYQGFSVLNRRLRAPLAATKQYAVSKPVKSVIPAQNRRESGECRLSRGGCVKTEGDLLRSLR